MTNWERWKKRWQEARGQSKEAEYVPTGVQGASIDPDDWKFRPLGKAKDRELPEYIRERMIAVVRWLWRSNPLAHNIIELTNAFVLGDGIKVSATDERVHRVVREFWEDPVKPWDIYLPTRIRRLALYGQLCMPVFVNPIDGRVRTTNVYEMDILGLESDPDDWERVGYVGLKSSTPGEPSKRLRVVNLDEDPKSDTYGYLMGDCFFFAINQLDVQGLSDLAAATDWLDALDQFLFQRLDRQRLMNSFIWDVTLNGKDEKGIKAWLQGQEAPKPGTLRAHNEAVTWQAVTPTMQADDATNEARLIKNYVLMARGLPEHWFSTGGGEGSRALAVEMNDPPMKLLTERQRFVKHMVGLVLRYVVAQAVLHRKLPKMVEVLEVNGEPTGERRPAWETVQVETPEMSTRDVQKASSALFQVAEALMISEQQGWTTQATNRRIFTSVVAQLGVEIDLVEEARRAETGPDGKGAQVAWDRLTKSLTPMAPAAAQRVDVGPAPSGEPMEMQ